MRTWLCFSAGLIAVAGLLTPVNHAGAETCKLEMKKVGGQLRFGPLGPPPDYLFRYTHPQQFFTQMDAPRGRIMARSGSGDEDAPAFSKVITKEDAQAKP